MNKLAAIYSRVSSQRQKEGKTIHSQTTALRDYAQSHNLQVAPDWIFEDEGYSGATIARPALERLRDLVAEGQVQVVLVHSPDRLSRKYAYQVVLLEEFSRHGVETVFLQGVSAQTPEEQLLVQFQGMIAEYERAQITERTRRGKRHRAKMGCVNVFSAAPYGYRYVKRTESADACYQVDETQAAVVRQIFDWYTRDDLSISAVVSRLNKGQVPTRSRKAQWKRSTVWAMLRNPAYIGRAAFGKTQRVQSQRRTRWVRLKGTYNFRSHRQRPVEQWIEVAVPALITPETFARAAEKLADNRRLSARNTKVPTLLQGLLICENCGYSLYRTSTSTTRRLLRYYRCPGSDRSRQLTASPCPCRSIRVDQLDELVWDQVTSLLENPDLIRSELDRRQRESLQFDPLEQRREQLTRQLKRVNQQVDQLLDAYQEGLLSLDQLRERMPQLRRHQLTTEKELQGAYWQALVAERTGEIARSLDNFLAQLKHSAQSLSVVERQKIVRLLIREILVHVDNRITIRHCLPLIGAARDAGVPTGSFRLCTGRRDAKTPRVKRALISVGVVW